jgi:hypothetical protein
MRDEGAREALEAVLLMSSPSPEVGEGSDENLIIPITCLWPPPTV